MWIFLLGFGHLACRGKTSYQPRNGDIIFQISQSNQSQAIQLATHSPYSHMGMVFLKNGEPFVFEAIEPVVLTPFREWIKRGKKGHFVVKRLKEANKRLTEESLCKMKEVGEQMLGKHYDLYFGWSDERIYCSELVWKVYARGAGIELGSLQSLGDFDLSFPAVKKKMRERYGSDIPLEEEVISPAAIYGSSLLETVFQN